jgi:ribosomal protein S18 acetylase RimI-like enzyme
MPYIDPVLVDFASNEDADLDSFSSGLEEIDEYFRSRQWFNVEKKKASPPTYRFRARETGEVFGYAAVVFKNEAHPHEGAAERARYLTIYAVGVHRRFHGRLLNAEGSYSECMFRELERMAREKFGCVGLSLWVRQNNPRAIRFYEKMGFKADPGGPIQRDNGAPHLTMRKILT